MFVNRGSQCAAETGAAQRSQPQQRRSPRVRRSVPQGTVGAGQPSVQINRPCRFDSTLAFAAEIDSPGITIIPGLPFDEAALDRSAEELVWRAERAAACGLALSFEPHYESIVPTPSDVLRLMDRAPGVMLTLDYAHFVFQGIDEREVDVLIPHTRHIHGRQGAPGLMQASVADGTIDFARIIRAFEAAGFTGYFSLEYQWDDWMHCKNVDCISETVLLRDLFLETLGVPT